MPEAGLTIRGFEGNDYLTGFSGDEILDGGAGDDTMGGSHGNDTYIYLSGLDHIDEYGGTDTLLIQGATINDLSFRVEYYNQDLVIEVDVGVDEIYIDGQLIGSPYEIENVAFDDGFSAYLPSYTSWLNGTSGADMISGNANDNTLIGKDGNDTIDAGAGNDAAHGGAGADTIHGDDGNDLLHGGEGDDTLYGDDGLDTLYGGGGADTFVFEAASAFNDIDVVKDFSTGDADVIDLIDILDAVYNPLSDLITDFVEMTDDGSNTVLKVDRDGTGGTYGFEQIATLEGVTGLTDEAALESAGRLIAA